MYVLHKDMFSHQSSCSRNFICSLVNFYLCCCVVFITGADGKKSSDCSTCEEIVDNFHKGLAATAKSNYGGGNTNWEEKSLGSYAFSEVRLVEIMENLCKDKSKECHTLLEEHEDLVESFWFKQFAQKTNKDFRTFLCIENVKTCCHNNTFGKDCSPCPGGVDSPCGGHGKCEGQGTRKGSGKCQCHSGYTGEVCGECKEGFYQEQEDAGQNHLLCKVCHISCKGGCSGDGPLACEECKDGWLQDEHEGCKDVDECKEDEPCEDNQYCTNTMGSHSCFTCNEACTSCYGSGPDKCNDCKEGYEKLDSGKCQDVNECSVDSSLCTKENEECINTAGSYQCICVTGYEYNKEDVCVKSPKESDEGDIEDENESERKEDENAKGKEEL